MKDGGPAFPPQDRSFVIQGNAPIDELKKTLLALEHDRQTGMTLRDYFAAKALPSCLVVFPTAPDAAANAAYVVADSMLKAREQS